MRVCLKSLPECSKSASLTSKTFCIQSTCPEPGPSFLEVTTVMMMMLENQYVRETTRDRGPGNPPWGLGDCAGGLLESNRTRNLLCEDLED